MRALVCELSLEGAQLRQRIARQRLERCPVLPPLPIDLGAGAVRADDEIGIDPDQAVPPPHIAAFDRLQQKITAPFHAEFQRGGNRRFGIGDALAPEQRRFALGQRGLRFSQVPGNGMASIGGRVHHVQKISCHCPTSARADGR